jgi:NmrA-like family
MTDTTTSNRIALVFGASGEQGRAVMEGLVDHGYEQVFGFTRLFENPGDTRYLQDALGCTLIQGDIGNGEDVRKALLDTRASRIFLVTTTELPSEIGQTTGCWNAMEAEFEVLQQFFDVLLKVHKDDGIARHVIFSTKDDCQKYASQMTPMEDGSLVPHYSAKGKGANYALQLLRDVPGLTLTLITLPFVYSNFLGFFTPLPLPMEATNTNHHSNHQWSISASLGDGTKPLEMMAVSDLSHIVRTYTFILMLVLVPISYSFPFFALLSLQYTTCSNPLGRTNNLAQSESSIDRWSNFHAANCRSF